MQDTANTLAAVDELLPLLHDMEGVTSGSTIAPLAEAVLEGVAKAGSPAVAETVKSLRSATASRRRELAARKRKETLAAMGMQQVLYCPFTWSPLGTVPHVSCHGDGCKPSSLASVLRGFFMGRSVLFFKSLTSKPKPYNPPMLVRPLSRSSSASGERQCCCPRRLARVTASSSRASPPAPVSEGLPCSCHAQRQLCGTNYLQRQPCCTATRRTNYPQLLQHSTGYAQRQQCSTDD